MRLGLLLVFAAVPFLEIAVLIKVGQAIGFWPTLMLVVLSAALGLYVIYEQGFQVMGRAMDAMQRGKAPLAPVIDGMFILLGGILLIVPGLISDAFGLALLIPRLRHRIAVFCLRRLLHSTELRSFFFRGGAPGSNGRPPGGNGGEAGQDYRSERTKPKAPDGDGPIIEGEFERLDERTIDRGKGRDGDRGNGRDDRGHDTRRGGV